MTTAKPMETMPASDGPRNERLAYGRAAAQACDLFAELGRRSQQLLAVAPRLRAKGAGAVIETLLDEDAVLPSARRGAMSDRGMRRRPRSPQPGAPHTYVTTPAFLTLWGLASLGDLPDLDRLEDAGLLGKAPLPEELRGALGITGDDEDEDRAASAADDDGEADGDYAGLPICTSPRAGYRCESPHHS